MADAIPATAPYTPGAEGHGPPPTTRTAPGSDATGAGRRGRGRRSFLRHGTGAALALVAAGAHAVLGARPAAAVRRDGCCWLAREHSPWCGYFCAEQGGLLTGWGCNNMACICYECFWPGSYRNDCYGIRVRGYACSSLRGCCGT